jgi:hypothetical protein
MKKIAAIFKPVRLDDARKASPLFDNDEAVRVRTKQTGGRGLGASGQNCINLS